MDWHAILSPLLLRSIRTLSPWPPRYYPSVRPTMTPTLSLVPPPHHHVHTCKSFSPPYHHTHTRKSSSLTPCHHLHSQRTTQPHHHLVMCTHSSCRPWTRMRTSCHCCQVYHLHWPSFIISPLPPHTLDKQQHLATTPPFTHNRLHLAAASPCTHDRPHPTVVSPHAHDGLCLVAISLHTCGSPRSFPPCHL